MDVEAVIPWIVLCALVFGTCTVAILNHRDRQERDHPCIESHQETIHVPEQITLMPVGDVMVPLIYPAYEYTRTVCDKRE